MPMIKNLYIRDENLPPWVRLEELASQEGRTLVSLVSAAVAEYVRQHDHERDDPRTFLDRIQDLRLAVEALTPFAERIAALPRETCGVVCEPLEPPKDWCVRPQGHKGLHWNADKVSFKSGDVALARLDGDPMQDWSETKEEQQ